MGQSKNDKTVVGTVGDQKVTYAELKANYSSGSTATPTLEDLESFLPIYLDYKAKLLAAKDQGYYQDSTLKAEHQSYVKQAAYAFWLEQEIKPLAFDEFKARSNEELKTYHILIAVGPNASQDEIDAAIEKLNEAKKEIESGVALDEVNQKYSSVRGGRSMGGDIPWISAGRTVAEFEDVAFGLEVGELSDPFKTQFGYHIVLLQDRRERTPARLTSHVFVRGTGDSTAYDKIYQAYEMLESGQDWGAVVNQMTEDAASKRNNGRIGWISYQQNFPSDIVEAVASVDPSDTYSEPFKSQYGFHIFKIDSVESYPSEEVRDELLMQKLKETPYYEESNDFVVDFLEEKFEGTSFEKNINQYKSWLLSNDTTTIGAIPSPSSMQNMDVYSFNGESYSVQDFHNYLVDTYGSRMAKIYSDNWFNTYTRTIVDSKIVELTISTYPDFQQQSDSYLNGLVVYNINEANVWSAATVDTSRLRSIYNDNISNYQYPERPFYYLLTARNDSTLMKAKAFVNNGGSPDSLRSNIERLGVAVDSTTNFTEDPFDRLAEMSENSFSEPFDYNNRGMFWLEERLPARNMTFDEAFNRVLSTYQPIREQEWLAELRSEYNIKVHRNKLKSAFRKDS
jgi:peptidyl-prolyl cis-trans isomerase SurA|tara:strand:+ start:43799 stop:45667 length:1869 start_codon:yes stop_codon:yes gene_type:complete